MIITGEEARSLIQGWALFFTEGKWKELSTEIVKHSKPSTAETTNFWQRFVIGAIDCWSIDEMGHFTNLMSDKQSNNWKCVDTW